MASYTPDSIHERLNVLLKDLNVTPYKLAQALGEKPTKLYNILNGKARPSYETLESILRQYPQINMNWLFRGEGEMLIENTLKLVETDKLSYVDYPFVSVRFYGSFIGQYTDSFQQNWSDTYRVFFNEGEKVYNDGVIAEVEGNSMAPRISAGTKILIVPIVAADWAYQSSGIYAIMFKDFFVVKRIKDNELLTKNILMLHSDNTEAGSMLIHGKDLRGMWKVVKIVEAAID
ncbi:MAG: helix-turn-helix domain-containing protein [Verrucomicrobia bacterium]|nr:helix-turn-helix domain-containing protein [Cytophagales bacterium]